MYIAFSLDALQLHDLATRGTPGLVENAFNLVQTVVMAHTVQIAA